MVFCINEEVIVLMMSLLLVYPAKKKWVRRDQPLHYLTDDTRGGAGGRAGRAIALPIFCQNITVTVTS